MSDVTLHHAWNKAEDEIRIALKRFVLSGEYTPTEEDWDEALSFIPPMLSELIKGENA